MNIKYLDAARDLLRELYSIEDSHSETYERTRNKLDSFMQAGVVIGIASKKELQDIIDKEHIDIFSITKKTAKKLSQRASNPN